MKELAFAGKNARDQLSVAGSRRVACGRTFAVCLSGHAKSSLPGIG